MNTHTPAPVPADTAAAFRLAHLGHTVVSTPNLVACRECDTFTPTPAEGGPMTCRRHPAFHADYCPTCGTAAVIGGTRVR